MIKTNNAFLFFKIITAGIAGTAAMTLFVHKMAHHSDPKMKVVPVLGTMLTNETRSSGQVSKDSGVYAIGAGAHYSVGIGFALSYLFLWKYNFLKPDFKNSLLLGTVSGMIGVMVWKKFFDLHPNPPQTPIDRYLTSIFFGHLLFAPATTYVFKLLAKKSDMELDPIMYS